MPGQFLILLVASGAVRVDCDALYAARESGRVQPFLTVNAPTGALGATLLSGSLFLAPPGTRPRFRPGRGAAFKAFSFGASLVDAFASESSMGRVVETLADLASRFSLNPSYLSRAFGKETGSTIVEYVNKVRIQKSCVLLKRSSSSILDIAFAVGYNSLSHFNQCFRRITGMSPREFRSRSQR